MLARYTRPEMAQLWLREETKFEYWLKVELAWLEVRADRGEIPREAFLAIRDHAKINVARMKEIEAEVEHDMIAFVMAIQESLTAAGCGEYASYFHELLTSYNTEDPATILQLRVAVEYILLELGHLRNVLRERAVEHMSTYMIMRTHGQFAEPSTFAHLLLVFANSIGRSIRRLESVYHEDLIDGNISGAVGSYGEIDPELEEHALTLLGLRPAFAETQILQRDRHAALLSAIAIAGASIEQMARTFWEMCRSEVRELREPRKPKQKGSSAMAHKMNPIGIEQMMGLARKLRADAHAAMENIATPEARDISQSSVERHIFADATGLLHYMAYRMTAIVRGLVVFPDRMKWNLTVATQGMWAGQPVRNALMRAGIDYKTAYDYIQACSLEALESGESFKDVVSRKPLSPEDDRTAFSILGQESLDQKFDYVWYVGRGVAHIYQVNGLAAL